MRIYDCNGFPVFAKSQYSCDSTSLVKDSDCAGGCNDMSCDFVRSDKSDVLSGTIYTFDFTNSNIRFKNGKLQIRITSGSANGQWYDLIGTTGDDGGPVVGCSDTPDLT